MHQIDYLVRVEYFHLEPTPALLAAVLEILQWCGIEDYELKYCTLPFENSLVMTCILSCSARDAETKITSPVCSSSKGDIFVFCSFTIMVTIVNYTRCLEDTLPMLASQQVIKVDKLALFFSMLCDASSIMHGSYMCVTV